MSLLIARRGYTLIEILVALVLLGIVSAGVYKVLVNNQRIYTAQTQRIDLQQNIRAAAAILPAEFRQLDAAEGDITALGPDSIRMRAIRQLAFICAAPPLGSGIGQLALTIRQTPIYGNRQTFAVGDSLLIYWEGDPANRSDDTWLPALIQQAPGTGTCSDGAPAFTLTLQPGWMAGTQFNITGAITNGSPVLRFNSLLYRSYADASGTWWLGVQNLGSSGSIQPLVGPLIGSNGVAFSYFDSAGVATTVPTQVAQIQIVLRARTALPVRDGTGPLAYKVDSAVTWVALRNNPRCGPGSLPPRAC